MPESGGTNRKDRLRRIQRGVSGYRPSRVGFERLIQEALASIPAEFRDRLENVAIIVEEWPSPRRLREVGLPPGDTLLGLYEGTPLTQRGEGYNLVLPDRITLFRGPILSVAPSREEVVEQVRRTVIHEVAHFYGIDDDELDMMGYA